ncbi:hypothetical protein LC55x_1329 [Lysobacter capsici]|nr:hypothetical protein LC55x_1329 [Lysobacter capsici]
MDGAATGPTQTRWTGRKPAEWAMPAPARICRGARRWTGEPLRIDGLA